MLGLSMGMSQSQRQVQICRLTQAQRQAIAQTQLSLRLDFIAEIHGIRYTPSANCPNCDRKMSPLEIIQGFNNDPIDYRTTCTGCSHRFCPQLKHYSDTGGAELPFYCATQTLAQLERLSSLNPEELQKSDPAVYHSAIVHFLGLRPAFRKIGVVYPFDEIVGWQEKVTPYLGKLPDTIIAETVMVPLQVVRRLRRSKSITAHRLRDLLD
jgi:hypothetical protein